MAAMAALFSVTIISCGGNKANAATEEVVEVLEVKSCCKKDTVNTACETTKECESEKTDCTKASDCNKATTCGAEGKQCSKK